MRGRLELRAGEHPHGDVSHAVSSVGDVAGALEGCRTGLWATGEDSGGRGITQPARARAGRTVPAAAAAVATPTTEHARGDQ